MTDHVPPEHRPATTHSAATRLAAPARAVARPQATPRPQAGAMSSFVSAATRIRPTTAPLGQPSASTVIRRFAIRAKKVNDPSGATLKGKAVQVPKPLIRTEVNAVSHIGDLVSMIEKGMLDEEELVNTFKGAFAEAKSSKVDSVERDSRAALAEQAWTAAQDAYQRTHGKALTRPGEVGGKKVGDFRQVKAASYPTDVALTMPSSFRDDTERACQALVKLNPKLVLNVERVARTLYWFAHEAPREQPDTFGHPTYKDFPAEIEAGVLHWHDLGVNLAIALAKLFEGLNDEITSFSPNAAGAMRGKVAEIRDVMRSGPRSAPVKGVESGNQKYAIRDAVRGEKSVPVDTLKTAKKSKTPLDAQEFEADVDRIERLDSGDELWCEVKFSALTAANKHSDVSQLDRLCATVKRADRVAPLKTGRRIPVVSIVELDDFDDLWIRSASQYYVHYQVHLLVAGKLWTPDEVRKEWLRHAGARAKSSKAPTTTGGVDPLTASTGAVLDAEPMPTTTSTSTTPDEREGLLEELDMCISRRDLDNVVKLSYKALDVVVPPDQLAGAVCCLLVEPTWARAGLKLLDRMASAPTKAVIAFQAVGATLANLGPAAADDLLRPLGSLIPPKAFGHVLVGLAEAMPMADWLPALLGSMRKYFPDEGDCPAEVRSIVFGVKSGVK